jgi:hypothetical protein
VAYQPNIGELPAESLIQEVDEQGKLVITGYRAVHVRLFGGWDSQKTGNAPWPAAGRQPATRWSIEKPPHASDIEFYEVV